MSEYQRELCEYLGLLPKQCRNSKRLSEMQEIWWIFIPLTDGIIMISPDVHKQWITLHGINDTWIIVHCEFLNHTILAVIISVYHFWYHNFKLPTKNGEWCRNNCMLSSLITWLSAQMTPVKHYHNVSQCFSCTIVSDRSRKTQFVKCSIKHDVLLRFASHLYLASGWNLITMSFGLICDI